MKLIWNWKEVAQKSWAIKLSVLSAALSALELAMPLFNGVVPQKIFATASMLTMIAAAVARVVSQPNMTPPQQ
jgi:hypothetical protein